MAPGGAGFYLVPRPDPYRPLFKKADGTIDTDAYLHFFDEFITYATTGNVAAFVLEPVQGWRALSSHQTISSPAAPLCDERGILLVADEVLTGMGRTGTYFAMEHWDTRPDVVTLGKGFGNGFPSRRCSSPSAKQGEHQQDPASTSYGGNPMAAPPR